MVPRILCISFEQDALTDEFNRQNYMGRGDEGDNVLVVVTSGPREQQIMCGMRIKSGGLRTTSADTEKF